MSKFVLDASAIIAYLNNEKGAERVEEIIPFSTVSSVNATEVLTKALESGHKITTARESFELLGLEVIDFDYDQAVKNAALRPLTRSRGLSLGDRSCLALAALSGAVAVTADRDWKGLNVCSIEVIR